ncbi:4-hydroxy-3-methylbut-2-enyl diphosphate reductase [bacterium]|nr:4-hydroxy-3-methylbut-2-enyl diphosphate reductase [bacterium]
MKVKLAKTAGFCMGVKRAVELVLKKAGESPIPIFTLGPLIHNPQTVEFLKEQGVDIYDGSFEIPQESTVVIRSHGVPPDERQIVSELGVKLCDATCPKVARVQGLIKKASNDGELVIIIGNPEHAEVRGLLGYAKGRGFVVSDEVEIENIPSNGEVSVFGQTTINRKKYELFTDLIKTKFPQAKIFDTLCDSTSNRQAEIPELAEDVDAIIVIGGKNSGNTKRLYELGVETGKTTFWIETETELHKEDFVGMISVAVTAGASTPHWIVSRVVEKLEGFNEKHRPPWEWPKLKAFGYVVIQSNVLTGLSAALLGVSAVFLAAAKISPSIVLATGLFVMSMHTLYNLVDWQGLALVDPSKIRFFWGNRRLLSFFSAFSLLLAIPLAMLSGYLPFIMLCLGCVSALVFVSLKGMPRFLKNKGFGTWRSIPGAKDVLHASGWIYAAGLIPVLSVSTRFWLSALAILWVAVFSILRTILFSITDMETDRVLGRESVASIIGEKRAWLLTYFLMGIACALLILGLCLGIIKTVCAIEFIFLLYMIIIIIRFRRIGIYRGTWVEFAIDAGLLSSGILPLLMSLV